MELLNGNKYEYARNQLIEVICQLRFPVILAAETREPTDFQELVRGKFPRYALQTGKVQSQAGEQTVRTHVFLSKDGKHKISLTKNFIALSTMGYTNWDAFAALLDEPLGHFINVYRPAYFERIGLRYINGFSRSKLSLESCRWNELISPQYLGVLAGDVDENSVSRSTTEIEMKLDERCAVKLHAGPGHIKRGIRTGDTVQQVQEKEQRFIFDEDVFATGNTEIQDAAKMLEQLHTHATHLFSGALTEKLHEAMAPVRG